MDRKYSKSYLDYLHWFVLGTSDLTTSFLCLSGGYVLWIYSPFRLKLAPPDYDMVHFLLGAIIIVAVLFFAGNYRLHSSVLHIMKLKILVRSTIIGFIGILIVGFFSRSIVFGRLHAFYMLLLLIPGIVLERAFVDSLWAKLIAKRFGQKRILIYGAGDTGKRLLKAARRYPKLNYRVVGFLDDTQKKGAVLTANPLPVLGGLNDMKRIVEDEKIDEVWIAIPKARRSRILEVSKGCDSMGISYKFVPSLNELALHKVRMESLDGIPLFGVKTLRISVTNRVIKRIFDVVLTVLTLILLTPVMAVFAWLVKRDSPGPAIFRQKRVGLRGREFVLYKFRTLYVDSPPYAVNPTNRDDPRITKFGRFLRRTGLDELPQFWNVLKGDMSIVGPRPEMPFIVETYNDVHRERLNVKPGITGLWQISGDRSLLIHENIEHDLYYIEYQSPLLDLIIVFQTVIFAIRGVGAI